jgi:hypothetical protein
VSVTLAELRAEHQSEFIGPQLMRLLERVARATALTYPPSYADGGVWNDDTIADALHGWIADRLYGRRDLTNLLAGASSVPSLRSGLTRSFGQHLTSGRERTSSTNLYSRVLKLLRSEEEFLAVGASSKANEQLWTLADAPQAGPSQTNLRDRLGVAAELSDDDLQVVRYGPTSLKSSPILRAPALKQFVAHLLRNLGALTPADIMEIMRRRFGLLEAETTELVEETQSLEMSPLDEAAQDLIADSVASRTGAEDSRYLAALGNEADIGIAAQTCRTTEKAIKDAYFRMRALVIAEAVEPTEVDHMCGLILEILGSYSGNSV